MAEVDYARREVVGKPTTERVKKLYDGLLKSDLYVDSERCRLYTEYVKEHWLEHPYIRQGGALNHVLSNLTPTILDGELIVGRISRFIRGTQLYPEYESQWIRETFEGVEREEERYIEGTLAIKDGEKRLGLCRILEEDEREIKKVLEFWRQDWRTFTEAVYAERDDFELVEKWQQQVVFLRFMFDVPEGRVLPDYGKVIDGGLESLIERCREKLRDLGSVETEDKLDKYYFYKGTILALEGVIAFAENYAREAERLADLAGEDRKSELLEIARVCRKVPRRRAETFREAVQSFWMMQSALFVELNGRGISPGRFDQYMYRPFKNDIESRRVTETDVLELLELLRIKCTEIERAHAKFTEAFRGGSMFQNMTLGGVDREGNPADNELSRLILQAGINLRLQQHTISVRWNEGLSREFKQKVVECIKAGSGYPALVNDDLGIKRMAEVTGATIEDAREWAPCGCIDMNLCGKRTPQWACNNFNGAKILELVLNNGVNPVTGDKLAETGIDVEEATYEQIVEAFKRVMAHVVGKEAQYWNIAMVTKTRMGLVLPLMSAVLDDCIEKGMHCQEGGCRYNDSAYLISGGLVNVANSFAAMKKCVFEDKLITMKELRQALAHNFEGYEHIHRHLWKAPKFGNNDPYVDPIAAELYDAYSEATQSNPNWLGEPWRPSAISITTQVLLGNCCGATPDGRKAGDHLCDASLSAFPGTDLNGPTAVALSATCPDNSRIQGHLFNLKFHPLAISGAAGTDKFIAFNDTYFDLGGYHVQYNIVDAKMLRDAQLHPENYQDLMVRIAGFTARWVELGPAIQDEIISRTQHESL